MFLLLALCAVGAWAENGQLIAEEFRVWLNGEPLQGGETVRDGDPVRMTFSWHITNNLFADQGISTYTADLGLKGIVIGQSTGEISALDADGERVTLATYTYSMDDDGIFTVTLESVASDYSNIHGGVTLDGEVSVSPDRTVPDGTEVELGLGDAIETVIYSNPGSVKLTKSAESHLSEEPGYIAYTLTLTAQDIMTGVTLTDTMDAALALDTSSLAVKDENGADVTSSVVQSRDESGFTLKLPDSPGKVDKHVYTVTYRASLASGVDAGSLQADGAKNQAKLTYTDENGAEQTLDAATTTKFSGPSLKKEGFVLKTGSGAAGEYVRSYQGTYYYPVYYTLTVTPNDVAALFASGSSTPVSLSDTITVQSSGDTSGDSWFMGQMLGAYMNASVNNNSSGFYNNLKTASGDSISSSTELYANQKRLSDADIVKALANTRKLFRIFNNNPGYPVGAITTDDFIEESNGTYTFPYLVYVPSDQAYSDTFTNDASLEIDGFRTGDKTSVKFEITPPNYLIKGPDGLTWRAPDKDETASGPDKQRHYDYNADVLGEDETLTTVNYAVALDMSSFKGTSQSPNNAWQQAASKIQTLTFIDYPNGGYFHVYDSNYTGPYITSTSTGGAFDSSSIKLTSIDVYRKQGQDASFADTNSAEYEQALSAFTTYGETYGWFNDSREGYPTAEWDQATLISLWNAYSSAYDKAHSGDGYIGSVANLNSVATVAFNNGQLKVTLSVSALSSLSRQKMIPTGETQSSGSDGAGNMTNIIGGNMVIVLRYSIDLSTSSLASLDKGTPVTATNGAVVYFGDDENPNDDPIPPSYVNTSLVLKKDVDPPKEPTLTVSKKALDSVTVEDTYSFTNTDTYPYTIGWQLQAQLKDFTVPEEGSEEAPHEIVLTDTLDDHQSWDVDGDGFVAYASTGTTASATKVLLPEELYTKEVSGNTLTIRLAYTEDLDALLKGLSSKATSYYVFFYVRSQVNGSALVTAASSVKVENNVVPTLDGKDLPPKNANTNVPSVKSIDKDTMNVTFSAHSNDPFWEDEATKEKLYGYYEIELNPEGIDMTSEETVEVRDVFADASLMELDAGSVQVVSAGGGALSFTLTEEADGATFTVPDDQHLYIRYRVLLKVDPLTEPFWVKPSKTGNTVTLDVGLGSNNPSAQSDWSDAKVDFSVWIKAVNGELTLLKLDSADNAPLAGAQFALFSVYDNLGTVFNTSDPATGEMLHSGTSDDEGGITFSKLPLSRIYRVKEIAAPDGYVLDKDNEIYVLLEGDDEVTTPDFLADKTVLTYGQGDPALEFLNKKQEGDNEFYFSFTKRWKGEAGPGISFTVYNPDGTVHHHGFNRTTKAWDTWLYEAWFEEDADYYIVEKPIPGWVTTYENVGEHEGDTDACYNGGTIVNKWIPATGERRHPALWLALAMLSLIGIAVTGKQRHR